MGPLPKHFCAHVSSLSTQILIIAAALLQEFLECSACLQVSPLPLSSTLSKIIFLKCTSGRSHPLIWGLGDLEAVGDLGLSPTFLVLLGSVQPLRVLSPSAWPSQTPVRLLRLLCEAFAVWAVAASLVPVFPACPWSSQSQCCGCLGRDDGWGSHGLSRDGHPHLMAEHTWPLEDRMPGG